MLLFTGFRLSSPHEFANAWRIGYEQLAALVTTMVLCFAIDLLVGVAAGLSVVAILNVLQGAPLIPEGERGEHVAYVDRADFN